MSKNKIHLFMHLFIKSFAYLLIQFLNAFMSLFIPKCHLLKVFYGLGTI